MNIKETLIKYSKEKGYNVNECTEFYDDCDDILGYTIDTNDGGYLQFDIISDNKFSVWHITQYEDIFIATLTVIPT